MYLLLWAENANCVGDLRTFSGWYRRLFHWYLMMATKRERRSWSWGSWFCSTSPYHPCRIITLPCETAPDMCWEGCSKSCREYVIVDSSKYVLLRKPNSVTKELLTDRKTFIINQDVLPYKPHLLKRFPIISTRNTAFIQAIKNIYKHIFKGYGCIITEMVRKTITRSGRFQETMSYGHHFLLLMVQLTLMHLKWILMTMPTAMWLAYRCISKTATHSSRKSNTANTGRTTMKSFRIKECFRSLPAMSFTVSLHSFTIE